MPSHAIKTISKHTFDAVLSLYSSTAPEKLRDLDAQRYDAIPAAVAKREDEKYLSKEEVLGLVEWKLYVRRPFHPCLHSCDLSKRSSLRNSLFETIASTTLATHDALAII
jgi:hypothetical protein